MPLAVVNAPRPPAFVTYSAVSPVAEAPPPLITNLSEGEPSVPRNVLSARAPPEPT
jgi:hypothetical protein